MNKMSLDDMLYTMTSQGASDLYLSVDAPPSILVDNRLVAIDTREMTGDQMVAIAREVMDGDQWEEFLSTLEMDLAYVCNEDRFRISVYFQRNSIAMVARLIRQDILSFENLGLPEPFKDLAMLERGLVLITGATGSGKSTTLATMIDWRNRHGSGHIVTVEDPIEFIHQHRNCIVSQREVGIDTKSFHMALRSALRQAPKVILIGEIRDSETAQFCLHASETGHLVFSTLHTINAHQTMERFLGFFPAIQQPQALAQMSLNLKAIVSQRLIPKIGGGRVVALEVLINTPRVAELIKSGAVEDLKTIMQKGQNEGMMTFDISLYHHVQNGLVSEEDALRFADSGHDLKLRLKGLGGSGFA